MCCLNYNYLATGQYPPLLYEDLGSGVTPFRLTEDILVELTVPGVKNLKIFTCPPGKYIKIITCPVTK